MNQKLNKTRQLLVAFILLAAFSGFTSCEKFQYAPPAVDQNKVWHLSTDIQPIFNAHCITCHSPNNLPDLHEGKSWKSLTTGGFVNLPAATSRLHLQMTSSSHTSRSSDAEKLMVLYWIQQGALNN